MQLTAIELRNRRLSARIPGRVLSAKADISRNRLSEIERGYVRPSVEEMERLNTALSMLIEAHQRIAAVAQQSGWPTPV
jgi:transcriptional regulator with XRE-family HTH domain